jgi:hypothetical protein
MKDSLKNRIRLHIEQKFEAIELDKLPFPHLIIEGFFPDDVYQKILEYNLFKENRGTEWLSKSATRASKTGTPYYARKQINFHANDPYVAGSEEGDFWNSLSEIFLADSWFEKLVFNKYPDYFYLRFGNLCQDSDFFNFFKKELFLQRHEVGYKIGPHTDIPTRVFTCIFAFAETPGYEHCGTELLSHQDRLTRCWGNNHYDTSDFKIEKIAPYSPNNFLLFFKTRQSFHSVCEIDDTVPNQRYGIQFQFYEPTGGLFKDLSEPEIMYTRHRKTSNTLDKIKHRLVGLVSS